MPQAGRYFVTPAVSAAGGAIRVDGASAVDGVFELSRGRHRVESAHPERFHLLWLPRDGAPWTPALGAAPRFSSVL